MIKEFKEDGKKGSPDTSLNQVAGGFKKVKWKSGTVNLDMGGGKYDKASDWLRKNHDVMNYVYDPYNRSNDHNRDSWINTKDALTTTIFNVLNVIPESKDRIALLKKAKRKGTKHIYITVYAGKYGDGKGRKTTKGWQNNMKLKEYLPEIKKVYSKVYSKMYSKVYSSTKISKGMIVIDF